MDYSIDNKIGTLETWFIAIICLIFIGIFIGKVIEYENRELELNINNYDEYIDVDFYNDVYLRNFTLRISTSRRSIYNLQITLNYVLSRGFLDTEIKEYDVSYLVDFIKAKEYVEYTFNSPEVGLFMNSYKIISISGGMD